MEFKVAYHDWRIDFKCECGEELTIDDLDINPVGCSKCDNEYSLEMGKWELKKENTNKTNINQIE